MENKRRVGEKVVDVCARKLKYANGVPPPLLLASWKTTTWRRPPQRTFYKLGDGGALGAREVRMRRNGRRNFQRRRAENVICAPVLILHASGSCPVAFELVRSSRRVCLASIEPCERVKRRVVPKKSRREKRERERERDREKSQVLARARRLIESAAKVQSPAYLFAATRRRFLSV